MAIGLDLDTEYANRTGIPNGGAGTLTAGGFADFFVGVWLYRPSATATYALTAGGAIIHGQAGAREVFIGFNNAGAALADLRLYAQFNSGVGGADFTFAGHAGNSFLDEWVYYFWYENAANETVAGYIRHADLNTAVTGSRANDNAGSQYINTLTFGNTSGNTAVVLGHYAYARARDSAASAADVLTYANSSATIAGDWGFWPLANNTDTGDTSGNARPLTFGGTLTSETSPVFGTAPVIDTHPVSQTVADGATATFTATSAGATSFQWQSNQTGAFANISGATSSSYTTPATTQAYQGRQFRMVATNATGSATSGAASLGVTGFPVYLWSTAVQSGNDVWLRDPTMAGAAGSIALTGVSGVSAVGSVAASLTVGLTGVSGVGAVGAVAPSSSVALTQVGGTGSVGTVAPASSVAITGNSATGSVGSVAPAVSAGLTQTAATGSVGTLAPSTDVALTQAAATGSVGTVTVEQAGTVALTGVSATGSVGTVAPQSTVSITGNTATGSVGTVAATSALALTGNAATGSAGSVSPNLTVALTGVSATGSVGSVAVASPDVTVALTGVQAVGAVGSLVASGGTAAVGATPGWGTYPFRRSRKAALAVETAEQSTNRLAAAQAAIKARQELRRAEQRDQAITAQLRDIYAEQDALAMGIAAAQQDLAQQLQDDDDLSMILALAS